MHTCTIVILLTPNKPNVNDSSDEEETIPCIKKGDMKNDVTLDIPIKVYNGPKKPDMPQSEAQCTILPLKILAHQIISH